MFSQILCLCLGISISTATNECVSDQCQDDSMRTHLSSWYDEWVKGFEVDYITINDLRLSYDFIVVGAGIGGSIVAHRLAMDSSYPSVLLLEAGSKHNTSGLSNQLIPALVAENQNTDIDWAYRSEPSDGYCCEWNVDKRHAMPRGKVAGGSSVLNYMMWVRGHKEDWDVLFNIDGWKWNDVLPYYMKTEAFHRANNKLCNNVRSRGCDGPIIVNDGRNLHDKYSIFAENAVKGFVESKKFKFLKNGQNSVTGSNIGVAYTEFNIDDMGQRNDAFLGYNKYLRNHYKTEYDQGLIKLDILTHAHVTKLLFDDNYSDLLRVKSVEFADLNNNRELHEVDITEKGEVILGAGSFNTPQILMLSGLGPKEELIQHNIDIISDIPGIGNNLQDHTMSFMRYHFKKEHQYYESVTADRLDRALNNFTEFKDYLLDGKSNILSNPGANVNAFIRSHVMNTKYGTKYKYPDLQFFVMPGWGAMEPMMNKVDNYLTKYQCGDPKYYKDKENVHNILTSVGLQHPESRGWVRLSSSSPFDYPLIQPNYLKEQFDVDAIIEGHKILSEVMSMPSIKQFWDEKMECKKYGDIHNNNTNLEKYIRDSINNIYHPVGTCYMGDIKNDKMAVIDNKLLVRNTLNLRIADASIYPHQTSGNTQSPTYMVGEKAASIILQKWNS